jgi:flagellar biogenesis protein FliO
MTEQTNPAGVLWQWLLGAVRGWRSRPARQLRLCETLTLGERRFLAIVQFQQEQFLIGGTATSVALLAQLPGAGGRTERTGENFAGTELRKEGR